MSLGFLFLAHAAGELKAKPHRGSLIRLRLININQALSTKPRSSNIGE